MVVHSYKYTYVLFTGAKNSKDVAARDYQSTGTIDNEAYEQSIAVTSSPKVHYQL